MLKERSTESSPFLFRLKEDVFTDNDGYMATIIARCETIDMETNKEIAFYLLSDGEEEWEMTEENLQVYNNQDCKHSWSSYEKDKTYNICIRCGKRKRVNELH